MSAAILMALAIAACAAETPFDTNSCPPFAKTQPVTIDTVIDGDTVRLADGRKIRLIGINTPELARDGKPDQPFARQAKQKLGKFLGQHALLLIGKDNKDRHGRTLAHLYSLNGDSAEAHLLQQGLGWHIAIPPNTAQADCLAKAEQQARHNKRALWGSNGIVATPAKLVNRGGFQRIKGSVTKISFGKGGWWINMGDQVAAVIYPENQHRFNRAALQNLQGKTIEIRGWVYPSRSKKYQPWRITLATPYAIE